MHKQTEWEILVDFDRSSFDVPAAISRQQQAASLHPDPPRSHGPLGARLHGVGALPGHLLRPHGAPGALRGCREESAKVRWHVMQLWFLYPKTCHLWWRNNWQCGFFSFDLFFCFFLEFVHPLQEIWVAFAGYDYSSCKSSANHSKQCVSYCCVSREAKSCQGDAVRRCDQYKFVGGRKLIFLYIH